METMDGKVKSLNLRTTGNRTQVAADTADMARANNISAINQDQMNHSTGSPNAMDFLSTVPAISFVSVENQEQRAAEAAFTTNETTKGTTNVGIGAMGLTRYDVVPVAATGPRAAEVHDNQCKLEPTPFGGMTTLGPGFHHAANTDLNNSSARDHITNSDIPAATINAGMLVMLAPLPAGPYQNMTPTMDDGMPSMRPEPTMNDVPAMNQNPHSTQDQKCAATTTGSTFSATASQTQRNGSYESPMLPAVLGTESQTNDPQITAYLSNPVTSTPVGTALTATKNGMPAKVKPAPESQILMNGPNIALAQTRVPATLPMINTITAMNSGTHDTLIAAPESQMDGPSISSATTMPTINGGLAGQDQAVLQASTVVTNPPRQGAHTVSATGSPPDGKNSGMNIPDAAHALLGLSAIWNGEDDSNTNNVTTSDMPYPTVIGGDLFVDLPPRNHNAPPPDPLEPNVIQLSEMPLAAAMPNPVAATVTAMEVDQDSKEKDKTATKKKHRHNGVTRRSLNALHNFYARAEELQAFRKENSHCNVPQTYPQNQQLANWVARMRREKKKLEDGKQSILDQKKVEHLEKLGFEWGQRRGDRLWMERFNQLKEFYLKNKHTRVPTKAKVLGRWVSTQRDEWRKLKMNLPSALDTRKLDLLNQLDFCFDCHMQLKPIGVRTVPPEILHLDHKTRGSAEEKSLAEEA